MSLRSKIACTLACLALAAGAATAWAAYNQTQRQLRVTVDDALRSRVAIFQVSEHRGPDREQSIDGRPEADECPPRSALETLSAAQLVSSDGQITPCLEDAPALPTDTESTAPSTIRTVEIGTRTMRLLSVAAADGGRIELARGLDENERILARLRVRLAAFVAAAGVFAAIAGWIIATTLVRPIVALGAATRRIAATTELDTPGIRATGEVGALVTNFNVMLDALRRSRDQQRRLVADAGHEMRTPLTSLHSNLDLVRQLERVPPDERHDVIDDIVVDVTELSEMVEELVDLAGDFATSEPTEPVQLADLARTVAARATRRTGRRIDIDDIHDAGPVDARPRQLERAIGNLVDNAIKYSPSDSPITVRVDQRQVEVLDQGRGLPVGDESRLFDRFYRAVEVQSLPGSGLGLAIVAEIIRTHHGTVFAENRAGGGARVGFVLPSPAR